MKAPKPQYLLLVKVGNQSFVTYFKTFAQADQFAYKFLSKKSIYWHIRDMVADKIVVRQVYGFYENLQEQKQ